MPRRTHKEMQEIRRKNAQAGILGGKLKGQRAKVAKPDKEGFTEQPERENRVLFIRGGSSGGIVRG